MTNTIWILDKPYRLLSTHAITWRNEGWTLHIVETAWRPVHKGFYLTDGSDNNLLFRGIEPEVIDWTSTGALLDLSAQQLLEQVKWFEVVTGVNLPAQVNNNPFVYQGEVAISITRDVIGGMNTEIAQAPFSPDIFYRMQVPWLDNPVTLQKWFPEEETEGQRDDGKYIWLPEKGSGIHPELKNHLVFLIENH